MTTDYIYVARSVVQKISKYLKDSFIKVSETDTFPSLLEVLAQDNDYIYASATTIGISDHIYKIRKVDMAIIAERQFNFVETIIAIDEEEGYIYCRINLRLAKLNKSDLSTAMSSTDYAGNRKIIVDGDYIYCAGYAVGAGYVVRKFQKSDLSLIAESADYGVAIYDMTIDVAYIYIGGISSVGRVWKIQKSDMAKVAESDEYGTIYALANDDNNVYCGGYSPPLDKVWKIQKSDMAKVAESDDYGSAIEDLVVDDAYIYCGGWHKTLWKLNISDMSEVLRSSVESGLIQSILISNSEQDTPVLSTLTVKSLKRTREVNGAYYVDMQCLPDEKLSYESYIDVEDESYIVKKYEQVKEGSAYYNVEAHLNFVELGSPGSMIDRFYRTDTVANLATYILAGSNWTFGQCDIEEILVFKEDKRISRLAALNDLANQCKGELRWYSKTRVVDLVREIGNQTGLHIRVDKNAKSIKRTVDSFGLTTRLYPVGPDNFEVNSTILDDCNDETKYTPSGGASVAKSDFKMNGSQAITLIATALNETFINDLGAGSVKDLTGHDSLKFYIFSEVANASGFTFGIGEAAYTEITVNSGALEAGCVKEVILDLSGVADADKNAIRHIGFKNLTNGAATVIVDYVRAFYGLTYIDSPNIGLYKCAKEDTYQHSAKIEKTQHEIIIPCDGDTYVSQGNKNTNYGTGGVLKIRDYGSVDFNSLMKFVLTLIPTGATITEGLLRVNVNTTDFKSGGNADIKLAAASWGEYTATWNNKPATAGNVTTLDGNSTGLKEIDITSTVQAWWSGATANYGLVLELNIDDTNKTITLSSREGSIPPTLKIKYTVDTDPSSTILADATAFFPTVDEPKVFIAGNVADLSKTMPDTWEDEIIGIGDTLRAYVEEFNINTGVRVLKITEDLLGTDIDLELGNKAYTSIDLDVKRAKQLSYAMPFQNNPKIIDANAMQAGFTGSDVNK